MEKCKYCNKLANYQFKNGVWCCSKHPSSCESMKNKNSKSQKGIKKPWVKGTFEKGNIPWNKGTAKHTVKNQHGGYRKGSGRGKKGWYKGIFCDSSWELAYVIYCLDNKISIKRNTQRFMYIYKGKTKTYLPDFLVNDEIIEIKGYETEQSKLKEKLFPQIKVLKENDLKHVFEYVNGNYGHDFIKLYD